MKPYTVYHSQILRSFVVRDLRANHRIDELRTSLDRIWSRDTCTFLCVLHFGRWWNGVLIVKIKLFFWQSIDLMQYFDDTKWSKSASASQALKSLYCTVHTKISINNCSIRQSKMVTDQLPVQCLIDGTWEALIIHRKQNLALSNVQRADNSISLITDDWNLFEPCKPDHIIYQRNWSQSPR